MARNLESKLADKLSPNLQTSQWTHELLSRCIRRNENPGEFLQYLRDIPSNSDRSFAAFEVFRSHLQGLEMSSMSFVDLLYNIWGRDQVKIIVLWRRRMIESFVSEEIAKSRKQFMHVSSSEKDAIHVDKEKLEKYLNQTREYYIDLREALAQLGVDYEVLEYGRDLKEKSSQLETTEKLREVFSLPGSSLTTGNDEAALIEKQAKVPLERLVHNWQEVAEWGYDGDLEDWQDLFQ